MKPGCVSLSALILGVVVAAFGVIAQEGQAQATEQPNALGGRTLSFGGAMPQLLPAPRFSSDPAPATAPSSAPSNSGDKIADYSAHCGGPKALHPCVDEIVRVFKRLDELERWSRRTGSGYNAGNGLVGCAAYYLERYFPDATPEQCRSSLATFDRLVKVKPYLRRTAIRSTMAEKCKAL